MKQQDSPPFKSRNQTGLVWWWFLRKEYAVNLVCKPLWPSVNLNTSVGNFWNILKIFRISKFSLKAISLVSMKCCLHLSNSTLRWAIFRTFIRFPSLFKMHDFLLRGYEVFALWRKWNRRGRTAWFWIHFADLICHLAPYSKLNEFLSDLDLILGKISKDK